MEYNFGIDYDRLEDLFDNPESASKEEVSLAFAGLRHLMQRYIVLHARTAVFERAARESLKFAEKDGAIESFKPWFDDLDWDGGGRIPGVRERRTMVAKLREGRDDE